MSDPFWYDEKVKPQQTILISCCLWIYSFSLTILPPVLGFHHYSKDKICYIIDVSYIGAVYNLLAHIQLANIVIVVSYAAIFKIARRHLNQIAAMQVVTESQGQAATKFKGHLKAAKTLLIVIGIFMACWQPFCFTVFYMGLTFTGNANSIMSARLVSSIFEVFLVLNSAVNPLIYARRIPAFRNEFLRLLNCKRK